MTPHSFVVPAYGESPHLAECLRSLADQELPSPFLVATSTPNAHIARLAQRFGAPLHVNSQGGGIGIDWNFALSCATSRWVTIAHQDDVYLPRFAAASVEATQRHPDASLVFTRYAERVGDTVRRTTTLLRIKHALLELGFLGGERAASRFFKTNALRFGCAIPCPAVTINMASGPLRFREDLKLNLDWAAWIMLARRPGAFAYVREVLMEHRVHAGSETTAGIVGGQRAREDRALLRMLWPRPVADAIAATYGIAYRSNQG
jgi:hypothetical protein